MDEKFRKLQRAYEASGDPQASSAYIHALEQKLGLRPETKHRVCNEDPTFPCLLCEKPLEMDDMDMGMEERMRRGSRPWVYTDEDRLGMGNSICGVSVHTSGNYGSQVLDMHHIFFYICDGCIVKHSHKMLHAGDGAEHVQNARDYYEGWLKALKENQREPDEYFRTVSEYFK